MFCSVRNKIGRYVISCNISAENVSMTTLVQTSVLIKTQIKQFRTRALATIACDVEETMLMIREEDTRSSHFIESSNWRAC